MNLHALLGKLLFKFAHYPGRNRIGDRRKQGRPRNEPGDLAKILGFIRRDTHDAIRNKRVMERGEEVFCYKTPGRVTPFWPGVRKHNVKCRNGILRQQPLDGGGNLEPQQARIRQAAALDPSTGCAHSTEQTLDSEKIFPWILGSYRHEKRAVPAAKIDFDGRSTPVNLCEVETRETIRRDELGFAC
jgi:hypothetical protein